MPWNDETNQPAFIKVMGNDDTFTIPVFTTVEKLKQFSEDFGIPYDRIKHIDDGVEFLDSIPVEIEVIQDPYKHGDKTRYRKVMR